MAFRDAIHGAFLCVTNAQVKAAGSFERDRENRLVLTSVNAPLGRKRNLHFRLDHSFVVVQGADGDSRLRTTGYAYWLLDADESELVLYQWDPAGPSPVRTPHVHIGKALSSADLPGPVRLRFARLAAAHLPTGFVLVTDLLRTAIRDFDVEPLRRRAGDSTNIDWDGINQLFRSAEVALRESFD